MRISDWSSDVCSSDLQEQTRKRRRRRVLGKRSRDIGKLRRVPPEKGTDAQENQRKTEVGSVNRRGRRRTRDAPIRLVIHTRDRKSGVKGKSVSERVDLGGRRITTKKKNKKQKE